MRKLSSFEKKFSFILVIAVIWLVAMPAQAFYLEAPAGLLQTWRAGRQKVLGEQLTPPEQPATPAPTKEGVSPLPTQPMEETPSVSPTQEQVSPLPTQPLEGVPSGSPAQTSPAQTCNVNGKELPGPCSNYQQSPTGPSEENFGPNEEEMKKKEQENRQRQLADMKRGINQMSMNIDRLDRMFQGAIKKGIVIPTEVNDKLAKAKETIKSAKAAQSMEEMEAIDLESLNEDMRSLEEARQEYIEAAQRLQDIKRNLKNFEQQIKMFEKQVNTLKKQKMSTPTQVTDNLDKLKAIIATVKNAKTWAEVEEAGLDQMQEFMDSLQESRMQLEMLARWPQTLKEMDRQLKQLTNELKRSKTIITRLQKQDIDISSVYADFEAAINKLKAVRDEAANKIKSSDTEIIQSVFESIQDDFFGQTEDVWQNQRVIKTISNLGQFARDFKQGVKQGEQQINRLKKQGVDTAEIIEMFEQVKAKGNEILALVKVKPIDEDAIISGLMEMDEFRSESENMIQELTGKEEQMPWEKGPQKFTAPQLNFDIKKFVPQKKSTPPAESNPQPTLAPVQ